MKRAWKETYAQDYMTFSTLNSGLRDETAPGRSAAGACPDFQYPQLGPTR